jgi:hypothetical protein
MEILGLATIHDEQHEAIRRQGMRGKIGTLILHISLKENHPPHFTILVNYSNHIPWYFCWK